MDPQEELDRIGRTIASQADPSRVLALLLSEARRLTHAEAGTVYVRRGRHLHFAAVQNDPLTRRLGEEEFQRRLRDQPLSLDEPNIAGYVALTRGSVNIPDVYEIPLERPYEFDRQSDVTNGYRTRSMLAMPIRDRRGHVFGVLQLINAVNDAAEVVPFDQAAEDLATALLTHLMRQGALDARWDA